MFSRAHLPQQPTYLSGHVGPYHVQSTATNRSTARSMSHHHQRLQNVGHNQKKIAKLKQSIGIHRPKLQEQKQRNVPSTIQIPCSSISEICTTVLIPTLETRHRKK